MKMCPLCQTEMDEKVIPDDAGYNEYSYECPECGNTEDG